MNVFRKILIANRGEIAVRISRACRALGIASVAVYSDADTHAPHVKAADEAVHLGAAPSQDSYLNAAKLIAAAQRTNCQALHPGYGFLSENADFAEACAAAGLVFIGPAPAVIRQMGSKSAARQLAAAAGVPTVPGYDGADQRDETFFAAGERLGFPVLIKAAAGGGGKGMRVVRAASEFAAALASARREAANAFGDDTLLLEKFVEEARHIEFQLLGDQHGQLVHLFERDCSLQRRHQKVVEESPAPALTPALREAMGAAAVKLGQALGYVNAGTVEFILAPTGAFYFIEINPRLQVEHPVTEMTTGLDLVRLQIEIAEGQPLPFTQSDLRTHGHAIEARLCAEDPANDFLPATGTLHGWETPTGIDGLRVDAGVERGSAIGIFYDSLLAKLVAHGATRAAALRKLRYGLQQLVAQGLPTNRAFLLRLLESADVVEGCATTNFIGAHQETLCAAESAEAASEFERLAAAAVALWLQHGWQQRDALTPQLPPNFRNNPFRAPTLKLAVADTSRELELSWRWLGDARYEIRVDATTPLAAEWLGLEAERLRLALDGVQHTFRLTAIGAEIFVHAALGAGVFRQVPRYPAQPVTAAAAGSTTAPMPGVVRAVLVEAGQPVARGTALLVLEAMKIEHTLRAALDGVVAAILVKPGEVVAPGQQLLQLHVS